MLCARCKQRKPANATRQLCARCFTTVIEKAIIREYKQLGVHRRQIVLKKANSAEYHVLRHVLAKTFPYAKIKVGKQGMSALSLEDYAAAFINSFFFNKPSRLAESPLKSVMYSECCQYARIKGLKFPLEKQDEIREFLAAIEKRRKGSCFALLASIKASRKR